MNPLAKPGIDFDTEDLHALMQRRGSRRLLIGFLLSVAAAFQLLQWREVLDAPAGTRQWQPPDAGGDSVHAVLRPDDGRFVDLLAGDLRERHTSASVLFGRLGALVAIGHGVRPKPTLENRMLAARVVAHQAGVFDQLSVADLANDNEFMTDVFERLG